MFVVGDISRLMFSRDYTNTTPDEPKHPMVYVRNNVDDWPRSPSQKDRPLWSYPRISSQKSDKLPWGRRPPTV